MNIQQLPAEVKRQIPSAKLPVQYEEACKSLAECRSLDEALFWGNKADALAAWAKLYKSEQAAVEAKRLKLHAYRRMGEIAEQIRPTETKNYKGLGRPIGARSLLIEHGLKPSQSETALRISRINRKQFESIVELTPLSVHGVSKSLRGGSREWRLLTTEARSPQQFRGFCRKHSAKQLASALTESERALAKEIVTEIIEWLDEFEQHLKVK